MNEIVTISCSIQLLQVVSPNEWDRGFNYLLMLYSFFAIISVFKQTHFVDIVCQKIEINIVL